MKKFLKKAAMISAITLMAQLLLVPGMAMAEKGQPILVNLKTLPIKTTVKTDNVAVQEKAEDAVEAAVEVAVADEENAVAPVMENLENRVNNVNGFAGGEPQN